MDIQCQPVWSLSSGFHPSLSLHKTRSSLFSSSHRSYTCPSMPNRSFSKRKKTKNRRSLIETEIISFDFHSLFLCRAYTNPIVRKGNTSSLFFFKSFHSSHVALRVLPSNHKMLLRFRPFHLHVRRRIFDLVRWKSGGENISFRLNEYGAECRSHRRFREDKLYFYFFSPSLTRLRPSRVSASFKTTLKDLHNVRSWTSTFSLPFN